MMNLRRIASIAAIMLLAGCEEDKPLAPGPQPPASSEEFVQLLAMVYQTQDYATFSVLFADDFVFILDMQNPENGETQWDRTTELRLHQRMFVPENIPPGDPPLDMELWLQSVTVNLTPESAFTERFDLYTTAIPPGPYDSNRWIARSATYGANVFFQLYGETDFLVIGRASFTVLEDDTKHIGDPGKFLIVRWEDLGATPRLAEESGTWGAVKQIFRR